MAAQDVTDLEIKENIIWSTSRFYLSLLESFPKYVENFQTKWNDWQQDVSNKDPSGWSSVPSFTALAILGPKFIPLVVYQLALNPNDDTAVHLYTALETDALYLPDPPEATDTTAIISRAQQILRLSFERNRAVRNALADFSERCERVSRFHSSSALYTECAEYDALLAFGPSIVPHVMLQYARDVGMTMGQQPVGGGGGGNGGGAGGGGSGAGQTSVSGIGCGTLFWYELLHELVWGCKMGVQTVRLGEVYEWWEAWFQEGGWEGAPRFGRELAV